jgi:hypothetical protein
MLLLLELVAMLVSVHGCSNRRAYQGITIADDLEAEIAIDYTMLRKSILAGKKGFQSSIKELKGTAHRDYGEFCTHCEIVTSFFELFRKYPDEFSHEICDVHRTFRHLLLSTDEDRIKCSLTTIYYHSNLLLDQDILCITKLVHSKSLYIRRFSRLVCLSRARADLTALDDSPIELLINDEYVIKTVCQYWQDVVQAIDKNAKGDEINLLNYAEEKYTLIKKYRGLLNRGDN